MSLTANEGFHCLEEAFSDLKQVKLLHKFKIDDKIVQLMELWDPPFMSFTASSEKNETHVFLASTICSELDTQCP